MADTATSPAQAPSQGGDGQGPSSGGSSYGGPRQRREGGRGGGRDFRTRRKVCVFCVDKIKDIDYKDTGRLRRFISDRGKIDPRRKTGTCAKHQRRLAVALKRARFMALLPYTGEHIRSIEAGGHGSHTSRTDVGRPDQSRVEAGAAAPQAAAVPAEPGQGAPPVEAQAQSQPEEQPAAGTTETTPAAEPTAAAEPVAESTRAETASA
jgi:small subunit ribosomal protein S18